MHFFGLRRQLPWLRQRQALEVRRIAVDKEKDDSGNRKRKEDELKELSKLQRQLEDEYKKRRTDLDAQIAELKKQR